MKKGIMIVTLFLSFFLLFSCNSLYNKSGIIIAFNTTISISFDAPKDEADTIYDDIVCLFKTYSDLSDRYNQKDCNNVYTINHSDEFVEVDEVLIKLIKDSLYYQQLTNGYFNILVGNLSDIYKEIIETKDTSSLDRVSEEFENINNSSIEIIDNRIKINGSATIDLGAIAKGYALQTVIDYLAINSISNYLISAGTSSIGLGSKNGKDYRVGLKYDDTRILNLQNIAIGSSSIHEQNATIDGALYHHIINPKTGRCENLYSTIYLIGRDAALIDALTTAFFNMPIDDIENLCEEYDLKYLIYHDDVLAYQK